MKNPIRNVVVEYKNKRTRRANPSLWGDLDLKSISREIDASVPPSSVQVSAGSGVADPLLNKTGRVLADELSGTIAAEKCDDIQTNREHSVLGTVALEKEAASLNPIPKPEASLAIAAKHKGRSIRGNAIAILPTEKQAVTPSVADMDICSELSRLESENASLKRELIVKLRLENKKLSAMLAETDKRRMNKK